MAAQQKTIVIVCRKAPYGNSLAREAIDIALATAVFDQQLKLVFTGDGIWQLLKQPHSDAISSNNHGKLLSALPLYDIKDIYIDNEALTQRQLTEDDLVVAGKLASCAELACLIDSCDVVLNF